ncbi:MAG TPA: hypothetical protein VK638_52315 [Edaphobacter sp.]|nr:hypothetical protein [Edaphobacter sp.]
MENAEKINLERVGRLLEFGISTSELSDLTIDPETAKAEMTRTIKLLELGLERLYRSPDPVLVLTYIRVATELSEAADRCTVMTLRRSGASAQKVYEVTGIRQQRQAAYVAQRAFKGQKVKSDWLSDSDKQGSSKRLARIGIVHKRKGTSNDDEYVGPD